MSTLVSNLLDMARIESGEVTLNLQWQPLEEVVGAALDSTRNMLSSIVSSTVAARIALGALRRSADRTRAGEFAGKCVEVHAGRKPCGLIRRGCRRSAEVSVSDDGPGLPVGREESLFQNSRAVIANRQLREWVSVWQSAGDRRSHHGAIVGINRPDGGVTFSFMLPLGTPPVAAIEAEPRPPMAEPSPIAILVEDERQIRRFVRTALEAEGWNVVETETLRQG